jgi:hypothetical protein
MTKSILKKSLYKSYDQIELSIKDMQTAYQKGTIKGQKAADAFDFMKKAQSSISHALDILNM